jgi:hypothetical protein
MRDSDLDDLISDDFLESLEDKNAPEEATEVIRLEWVSKDKEHTTHKAWKAILKLKSEKENSIKTFGKVADTKTPKNLYEIKKSDVAKLVGVSSQSIFRASSFSSNILTFFEKENKELLKLHKKEQQKQEKRNKNTGVRSKKKEELVDDVQVLREKVKLLECRQVKEILDLLVSQLPLDLQRRLKCNQNHER